MNRLLRLLLAVALPACSGEVDEAGARALWEEIHADQYRSWQRAPG